MRHRLQWFIRLRIHGLRKGDEHPAYTPHGVWHILSNICPCPPPKITIAGIYPQFLTITLT